MTVWKTQQHMHLGSAYNHGYLLGSAFKSSGAAVVSASELRAVEILCGQERHFVHFLNKAKMRANWIF